MESKATVTIHNVPDYAHGFTYWVVTVDERDGSLWFFGAWNHERDAREVANRRGGAIVVENEN